MIVEYCRQPERIAQVDRERDRANVYRHISQVKERKGSVYRLC